jgi:hypothetical protein
VACHHTPGRLVRPRKDPSKGNASRNARHFRHFPVGSCRALRRLVPNTIRPTTFTTAANSLSTQYSVRAQRCRLGPVMAVEASIRAPQIFMHGSTTSLPVIRRTMLRGPRRSS